MSLFNGAYEKNKKCSKIVFASDDSNTCDFNSVSVRFLLGYVPTASMEPTLKTGSLILGVRVWRDIRKRDIIVFRHNKEYLVKRVEAVGGDLIERNGEDLVVPEGGFYVLGDNGQCSWDSRYWDDPFVPESAIVAKVWLPPGN